jgi:hypothetical protein
MSDTRPYDSPAARVKTAVLEAHRRGYHVSPDAQYTGVLLASTHVPTWERDARTDVISPLGAVLLVAQPAIPNMDDAIATALGTQIEYHLGYELGCAGEVVSEVLNKSPRARLAGQGFVDGAEMRALLHRRAGVPVARPVTEETTDRIPSLTRMQEEAGRRADLARLLNGVPLSAALELVAAEAKERMQHATDGRIREELDFVAGAAEELAAGAKDQGL